MSAEHHRARRTPGPGPAVAPPRDTPDRALGKRVRPALPRPPPTARRSTRHRRPATLARPAGQRQEKARQVRDLTGETFGWGTWIRTTTNGVRVRCSTVKLSPIEVFRAVDQRKVPSVRGGASPPRCGADRLVRRTGQGLLAGRVRKGGGRPGGRPWTRIEPGRVRSPERFRRAGIRPRRSPRPAAKAEAGRGRCNRPAVRYVPSGGIADGRALTGLAKPHSTRDTQVFLGDRMVSLDEGASRPI